MMITNLMKYLNNTDVEVDPYVTMRIIKNIIDMKDIQYIDVSNLRKLEIPIPQCTEYLCILIKMGLIQQEIVNKRDMLNSKKPVLATDIKIHLKILRNQFNNIETLFGKQPEVLDI